MASKNPKRQLAAILMADIAGFSRLTQLNEDDTYVRVQDSLQHFSEYIKQHNGELIGYQGDSVFAIFNSAQSALICAVEVQNFFHEKNSKLNEHEKIEFRIGLNLGDIIQEEDRVFGDDVNIASRIESLAPVGGISISGAFYDAVSSKVAYDFLFRGEQQVKNISSSVKLYDVVHNQLNVTANPKTGFNILASGHWVRNIAILIAIVIAVIIGNRYLVAPEAQLDSTSVSQTNIDQQQKPSIAVLPFKNLSNDPEQLYFSDGITEDLITDLSKVSGLLVIARASSFRFRQKELDIDAIGEALNINYLVTGSVRKLGTTFRISAQLLEIKTGKQIWGDRYDSQIDDVFTLQDEVLKKIVGALKVKLTDKERTSLEEQYTSSVEAYDLFLKGRNEHGRFSSTGNQAAKAFFEQAIAIDPGFAEAYAFLAWSYARDYIFRWTPDTQAALDKAEELIKKAMNKNVRRNVVYNVYGLIKLHQGQHSEAVSALEDAISVNPNYADSYAMLAYIFNYAGLPERSEEIIRKAMRLNPINPYMYLNVLGQSQYLRSMYKEAAQSFYQATLRNPEDNQIRLWLAASYAMMGDLDEAEWQVLEILAQNAEYSIQDLGQRIPFKNPEHLAKLSEGLRRAGLPNENSDI